MKKKIIEFGLAAGYGGISDCLRQLQAVLQRRKLRQQRLRRLRRRQREAARRQKPQRARQLKRRSGGACLRLAVSGPLPATGCCIWNGRTARRGAGCQGDQ